MKKNKDNKEIVISCIRRVCHTEGDIPEIYRVMDLMTNHIRLIISQSRLSLVKIDQFLSNTNILLGKK